MQQEDWVKLFRALPEAMHDQVVLSLSTGIDVYIQRFLQLPDQSLLVRGRLGGTDEAERIFLVPWPELKMIFFSRPLTDEILYGMFGDLIGGVRKSLATRKKEDEETEEGEDEEEPRPEPVRLPPPAPAQTPAEMPGSSAINMDELKSRLLQPRRQPARGAETNKPGIGKPPGKDTIKKHES